MLKTIDNYVPYPCNKITFYTTVLRYNICYFIMVYPKIIFICYLLQYNKKWALLLILDISSNINEN